MNNNNLRYGDHEDLAADITATLTTLTRRLDSAISAGCRLIDSSDAEHLTPMERTKLKGAVASVRNASGSARLVARTLLHGAGVSSPIDLVPRRPHGPLWPEGWLGTLAHDSLVAVAAIAPRGRLQGLGIDVEPAEPLPGEIYDLVVTPREHRQVMGDMIAARLLFVVKEAVYKATNPLDGLFLDHQDVFVDLEAGKARTCTGHCLAFGVARGPCLLAVAII